MEECVVTPTSGSPYCSEGLDSPSQSSRKLARQKEREERIRARLTDLVFDNICCVREGKPDFILKGVLHCILGSKSQFDARVGRMKTILPSLTVDCCQTFATISAVLLSSLGRVDVLQRTCNISTVNYLLYISAWLHQLSKTSWPSKGIRPSVSDLNASLLLQTYFPSKVMPDKFEIVFYNQNTRIIELLRQMCASVAKRSRSEDGAVEKTEDPVCGYVIVSGDYTVSIFCVDHLLVVDKKSPSLYSKAWTLYICDSHGTQPWSKGKASICGVTLGVPATDSVGAARSHSKEDVVSMEDGLHHFSTILFTLLEEHRTSVPRPDSIPYMTWTPISRRRSHFCSDVELKRIIQTYWLPKLLGQSGISREAKNHGFTLLPCFWGLEKSTGSRK